MADWLTYANQSAIRNDPLHPRLIEALGSFLPDLGVTVEVFSGGQEATGPNRTGSTRHDHGLAGDFRFYKNGRKLDWANPDDQPIFEEIVRRGKAAGITGIGAGPGYMEPGSMHLGFGSPVVWGDNGKAANAPAWLKAAYDGQPAASPAGVGRGTVAGFRKQPGAYVAGEYVPPQDVTYYADNSPLRPNIQTAAVSGTGDMRPTNFQRMAARQAMEGDQSQRARLLQAAGLDPTGKTRLAPRGAEQGILELLKLSTPAGVQPGGILGQIFNLFK